VTGKKKARSHGNGNREHPDPTSDQQQSELPAILFDLDGTLIDSVYEHVEAWAATLRGSGIVLPTWKIHRRIGMSGKSFARELLRELKRLPGTVSIEDLEQRHDKEFQRRIRDLTVLPGSQDLLDHLTTRKVRWAIATTGNKKQSSRLLEKLKLPSGTAVVTGDDVERAKPSPDIFMAAAEKVGVNMSDCIVVGDSVWDLLAAGRKSALGVGLLSGGYSEEELERAGAFRVYDDPADLLMHIEQLGIPGPRI
jgi:HAD superfamily hydrolase (TIGR01549 family)